MPRLVQIINIYYRIQSYYRCTGMFLLCVIPLCRNRNIISTWQSVLVCFAYKLILALRTSNRWTTKQWKEDKHTVCGIHIPANVCVCVCLIGIFDYIGLFSILVINVWFVLIIQCNTKTWPVSWFLETATLKLQFTFAYCVPFKPFEYCLPKRFFTLM